MGDEKKRYTVTVPVYMFVSVEVDAADEDEALEHEDVGSAIEGVYASGPHCIASNHDVRISYGGADSAAHDKATAEETEAQP